MDKLTSIVLESEDFTEEMVSATFKKFLIFLIAHDAGTREAIYLHLSLIYQLGLLAGSNFGLIKTIENAAVQDVFFVYFNKIDMIFLTDRIGQR